ncbi:hypothetical protein V5F72_05540 [Xanthobacter flavus]|uniref:hypothetical protein n=1 Tax=Xanthobacter flavus TaxID=281 RepID=UPI00372BB25C
MDETIPRETMSSACALWMEQAETPALSLSPGVIAPGANEAHARHIGANLAEAL